MTKKHYKKIAEIILLSTDAVGKHLVHKDQLISWLIQVMKEDNELFNWFEFNNACYKQYDRTTIDKSTCSCDQKKTDVAGI